MLITRKSQLTGKEHTLDLPVTQEQMFNYENNRMLAQKAFPDLPREQREFIISGITPEEWESEFGSL